MSAPPENPPSERADPPEEAPRGKRQEGQGEGTSPATAESSPAGAGRRKRGGTHRVLKLMPGGAEEGHPLSPAEARKARAAQEKFRVNYAPTPLGVPAWTIESGSGQTYRVLVPAFPDRQGAQCSCLDFLTRGLGTCKHLEATLAQAASAPPASLDVRSRTLRYAPGWARIDQEQERALSLLSGPVPPDPAVLAVALRRAGRLLCSDG